MMPKRLLLVPHYRVRATPLSVATTYAAAGYGIWQGVGILIGPPSRFGSQTFVLIRQSPEAWGLAALMLGMCVAYGLVAQHFVIKAIGLTGLSIWSLVFASTALNAYAHSPLAAPTAPPAYYFISVVLAILVWSDPKGTNSATQAPPGL